MRKIAPAFGCLCFLLTIFFACHKQDIAENIPACIEREIKDHYLDDEWQYSAVKEYKFQGNLVYVFNPAEIIADAPSTVKDANCTIRCTPGGYTLAGATDCAGEFFFQSATYIRTIWKR